jgi:hypothetical protein
METRTEDYTPSPGDIVVLRGLADNATQGYGHMPPAIGLIVKRLRGRRVFVRLHQGGPFRRSSHFARKGRIVTLGSIVRLATPRERTLGAPILETVVRAVAS